MRQTQRPQRGGSSSSTRTNGIPTRSLPRFAYTRPISAASKACSTRWRQVEFEAKLLARIHISEQEASSLGSTDEFAFSEYIVSAQEADGDVLFGRVLYVEKEGVLPEPYRALGDGRQAVLFRPAASPSSDMSSYISRWQRIYDRFDEKYGLNALVSVD